MAVLRHPLSEWTGGQRAAPGMREERLLRRGRERCLVRVEQVVRQRRRELIVATHRRSRSWGDGETVASAFILVGTPPVYLQVRVWGVSVQNST